MSPKCWSITYWDWMKRLLLLMKYLYGCNWNWTVLRQTESVFCIFKNLNLTFHWEIVLKIFIISKLLQICTWLVFLILWLFFLASNIMPSPNYFAAGFNWFLFAQLDTVVEFVKISLLSDTGAFVQLIYFFCSKPPLRVTIFVWKVRTNSFFQGFSFHFFFITPFEWNPRRSPTSTFSFKIMKSPIFNDADISWAITFFQFPSYACFRKTNLAECFGFLFYSIQFNSHCWNGSAIAIPDLRV